jgi:hypothetical protein
MTLRGKEAFCQIMGLYQIRLDRVVEEGVQTTCPEARQETFPLFVLAITSLLVNASLLESSEFRRCE